MIRIIGLLIFGLVLSACTRQPANLLLVPNQWPVKNSRFINSEENLPCFPWWKQFKDPGLDLLVDKGLIYNNDVKVAVANIEAAQGELKRVQLNWIPDVTGKAGYSSFPNLGFPGVLLTVVSTYTINIFKQVKEQKRAKYELKAQKSIFYGVRLAVINQIAITYISYLGQKEELDLLQTMARDLSRLITIYQTMFQGGIGARIELELAKTELSLIQAKERIALHNMVVSENALHFLVDENPGGFPVNNQFQNLSTKQMIIGALPLTIIENRPDMMQAKQEFCAANAGIGIAFSNFLPSINLGIARGEIAKKANGGQLGQAIHFNQAILEVPFLRASAFGELKKAKGLNKAAYYRYTDTLRKVLRDVTNDLSAHEMYTKRFNDVARAERDLRDAYHLNQNLYRRGIISHLLLMEEKVKLDKLAIEVSQYKLEQLITIVKLYHDLAAGYNYVPNTFEEVKAFK